MYSAPFSHSVLDHVLSLGADALVCEVTDVHIQTELESWKQYCIDGRLDERGWHAGETQICMRSKGLRRAYVGFLCFVFLKWVSS